MSGLRGNLLSLSEFRLTIEDEHSCEIVEPLAEVCAQILDDAIEDLLLLLRCSHRVRDMQHFVLAIKFDNSGKRCSPCRQVKRADFCQILASNG